MNEATVRRRQEGLLALALCLAPLAFQAWIVRRYAVNMPVWDEFYYVPFIHLVRTGGEWTSWIFLQHNEHRMVPMKLVLALLATPTSWSVVAQMYVSVLLVGLTIAGLWLIFHRASDRRALAFAPLAFLLCNPAQCFNMLTGIQTAFYFTLLGMIWSYALLQMESLPGTVAAAAFAAMACFSTANGFLVWPIGLLQLLASRARARRMLAWLSAAALSVFFYFRHYDVPVQIATRTSRLTPRLTLHFFLSTLGNPFGAMDPRGSAIVGAMILLLVAGWVARDYRRGELRNPARAGAYALIATGVLSAALVTYGRTSFGLKQALESRYVTFSELAIAGLYLLAIDRTLPKGVTTAFCALFALGLAISTSSGLDEAEKLREGRLVIERILLTYDRQPDSELAKIYFPEDLHRYAPYLRHDGLSAFHDRAPSPR